MAGGRDRDMLSVEGPFFFRQQRLRYFSFFSFRLTACDRLVLWLGFVVFMKLKNCWGWHGVEVP